MKIYDCAGTPSSLRLALFLAEIGVEVERVPVDIRSGENLSDTFREKSVNGLVPVLELDDGETICESIAICRYFDEAFAHEQSLFGNTPLEKAQIEMWNRVVEQRGLYVAFQAFRNLTGLFQDRENYIAAWGEESKTRLLAFLPELDQHLAQSSYVAGDRVSVADITTYVLCRFVQHLSIDTQDYPNLHAWFQTIAQRPAFKE